VWSGLVVTEFAQGVLNCTDAGSCALQTVVAGNPRTTIRE